MHLRQLAAVDPAAGGAAIHRGAAGGRASMRVGAAEAGGEGLGGSQGAEASERPGGSAVPRVGRGKGRPGAAALVCVCALPPRVGAGRNGTAGGRSLLPLHHYLQSRHRAGGTSTECTVSRIHR